MKKKVLPKGEILQGHVVEWTSPEAISETGFEPPWGVLEFTANEFIMPKKRHPEAKDGFHHVRKGDYLRIFNDAARSAVLWEGVYDVSENAFSRTQKGESKSFWKNIVSKKRPALLVRTGIKPQKKPKPKKEKTATQKVKMDGVIFNFSDQGSEGNIKSFQDEKFMWVDGKGWSYDGLHHLENGDLLTIFNDKARKDVLWHGKVKFVGEMANYSRGTQEGFSEESWENLFDQEKPATLVKRVEAKRKVSGPWK